MQVAFQKKQVKVLVPPGTEVFTQEISVLRMRLKAWLAAPVLFAQAEVTKNVKLFSMGPKLRYPAVATCTRNCQPRRAGLRAQEARLPS